MNLLKVKSHSPEQTQLLGNYLGKLAQRGDIFLLVGELGTGKTCLVQGMAYGLGTKEYAFSPSFVIVREYHGRLPLYHIDFYRLDHIGEIADLGLEEYFYGDGVCAVEWAEKGLRVLPQNNLLIKLNYVSNCETQRTISLKPRGKHYLELINQLKSTLSRVFNCHPEPFALCHSERSEESDGAQGKLHEGALDAVLSRAKDSSRSLS